MDPSNERQQAPLSLRIWFLLHEQRTPGYEAARTGAAPEEVARYRRNWAMSIAFVIVTLLAAQQFGDAARWLGISLWLLYFAALCCVVLTMVRYVAAWDELQQRIFIIAAANAFVVTVVALMLNLILPKIGVPVLNPPELVVIPAAAFFVFNLIARKQIS
jgi:hypothetical protein